ncbi:uncharacterized protein LOC141617788 [Silene latifolia]|uniref:uncharacterized protein LOC141617788 n=1 Tax=Silene latifolia TaxID=37657 RepID=UPI003D771DB9
MEYLSRILTYSTGANEFKYHPMCKQMKLTHLMFPDDLLLFCNGDGPSIMTILRSFATFSKTSGLNMSKGKSNAYFNGVNESLKQDILRISGMVEGALPFKYLGVPIKTTRLNAKDYKPLIDKILQRIRNLGARKLSYAGRMVLVKAVLKTLHNYWASNFILPAGVFKRIEAICINFQWDGGVDYLRSLLVSWEKICRPKHEGGLGLNCAIQWNKAAVGKLVWWLATKPDQLWVKWINAVYIKGDNWLEYSSTNNSSWSWRKICSVKSIFQESYQHHIWAMDQGRDYSIAKGYEFIINKGERVQWHQFVWNKYTLPKHSFLTWIYMHNALNTKDKLHKFRISDNHTCEICGIGYETASHLFFACDYSSRVLNLVGGLFGESIPADAFTEWRRGLKCSGMRKDVTNAIINACIYGIWKQRNLCKHELILINPAKLVTQIIKEVTDRTLSFTENLEGRDREWLEGLRNRA